MIFQMVDDENVQERLTRLHVVLKAPYAKDGEKPLLVSEGFNYTQRANEINKHWLVQDQEFYKSIKQEIKEYGHVL